VTERNNKPSLILPAAVAAALAAEQQQAPRPDDLEVRRMMAQEAWASVVAQNGPPPRLPDMTDEAYADAVTFAAQVWTAGYSAALDYAGRRLGFAWTAAPSTVPPN